ncbi:MAG: zinc-dependent metalloprotease, partial [Maribacter sp.]|nr:zinc-dependent metalloprotease [Maribacter sp.]
TNDRASVMDYPHPQFSLKNGALDFSNAYATGIGDWDKVTVAYSYADFPDGVNENEGLNTILNDAIGSGLRYITDQDARPKGSAHFLAHLWDNGQNVSIELDHMLNLRSTAIHNFSIDNIRTGEPNTVLEDVFVPLYFFHRYQTEAVAKVVGGMEYNYAVKGDGQKTVSIVDKKIQVQALGSILKTLDANEIAIPKNKLSLFPPRAFGYGKTRESFKGKTGVSFDALSAPETAADMTLGLLLHPERASRLIQQKAMQPNNLGLSDVLDAVLAATVEKRHKDDYIAEVQRNINYRVLYHLMNLAAHDKVHPQVNANANLKLKELRGKLMLKTDVNGAEMVRRIDKFMKAPEKFEIIQAPKIPDGSPIGMDCMD